MTKRCTLRITEDMMSELKAHLFRGDLEEHDAVIAAGVLETPSEIRLLVRAVFLAEDGVDYISGTVGYKALKASFVTEKILFCRDEGLAYLAVHCHGGSDWVTFSGVDMESHERGYPALLSVIREQPVGALVLSPNAVAGDVWNQDGTRIKIDEAIV